MWGIESEVAVISGLCPDRRARRRPQPVRAELAERLVRLDALVAAAGDAHLRHFLVAGRRFAAGGGELFPERLYG